MEADGAVHTNMPLDILRAVSDFEHDTREEVFAALVKYFGLDVK